MARKIRYAKGPVVYLYDLATRKKKVKQLLWGDWLNIGADINSRWSEVKWGKETFAIQNKDYQKERLLELIFLDVGQGDGCILTTPLMGTKEKIMIVDAGKGKNMKGFLDYRFRDFKSKFKFHAAVITHPDTDHYLGFQDIFENENISFENVYHNGLLERTGSNLLGKIEKRFLTDLYPTKAAAKKLYKVAANRGGKYYPKLIWTALSNPDRFDDITMLSTQHGEKENGKTWMPGFAPSNGSGLAIEVLGPVVQKSPNGKKGLRTFGGTPDSTSFNSGKTKNGHSVLLRLQYKEVSILFGGDLNLPAETFLLRHYGNKGKAPDSSKSVEAMIKKVRERFAVDIMKTCHHGAADVTNEFLEATQPAAFIVSSGDNESHVHPRPDLLGLLGKKGRGERPLILSTELLRSTREKEDQSDRRKLDALLKKISNETDAVKKAELEEKRSDLLEEVFKRNVGVYGAINIRTDGNQVVVAFRNEVSKGIKKWFYYELEKDNEGTLTTQGLV